MLTSMNPLLARLGYPADARLVIFHADDVGLTHGSNQAFVELNEAGIVKSGSVMMPCPWSAESLRLARDNPQLDLGVHLTLTCEWRDYRWRPVSTCDPESGLTAADGGFWQTTDQLNAHVNTRAAAAEMHDQVKRALATGVDITHLDSHMGVVRLPQLMDIYLALGIEYRIPILLVRQIIDELLMAVNDADSPQFREKLQRIEDFGLPMLDWMHITPYYGAAAAKESSAESYESILAQLQPGITYFSLHPNAPGEIETIDPGSAPWRIFEYEYFQSDRARDFLASEHIVSISMRQVRAAMRQQMRAINLMLS